MKEEILNEMLKISKDDIIYLLQSNHYEYLIPYIDIIYWIVNAIIIFAIGVFFRQMLGKLKKIRINRNITDLYDYYSEDEIKYATQNYITTHGQDEDPSNLLEPKESINNGIEQINLIKHFKAGFNKKRAEKKFYLVLGDSGMGKTTFLINLFINYKLAILPIKKKKIYLISLSDSNYREKIKSLESKETILLLDAFDEDVTGWADPEENLKELIKSIKNFSTVVLTSRGHFFSSKIDNISRIDIFKNLANKEEYSLDKIYLSPIKNISIYTYLISRYIFKSPFKIFRALRIVTQCPNLMVRPMLLNNVEYLLKNKKTYALSSEIYEDLILSWIKREKQYVDEYSVIEFSRNVAEYMYNKRNTNKGLYIQEDKLEYFLKVSKIEINSIILKTRSLLNRTKDKYKFSHKSIFEYFLALSKFDNLNIDKLHGKNLSNPFNLEGLSDAERFYKELFITHITIPYLTKYSKLRLEPFQLIKLKTLNLENSKINGLEFLNEMEWIENLNLNKTLIRNLKPLHKLKKLKKLEIKGTYYSINKLNPDVIKQIDDLKQALPNLLITN